MDTMKELTLTSKGWLRPYALACGYVEQRIIGKLHVDLWREHGVYHVRAHEFDGRGRIAWESFSVLQEARKAFIRMSHAT